MNKTRLTIEIDKALKQEIKVKSAQEGKTVTTKVVELIQSWLSLPEKI